MVRAQEGGCPTQVCSQGFCGPGWAWRGLWASLSSRGASASVLTRHVSQEVSVAEHCSRPAFMWGLWELGLTLGEGVCPPVF